MKKFLIVTKEKDFIINKTQLNKIKEDDAKMIYDSEGYWIRKNEFEHPLCDGSPRIWVIEYLKTHKVGDFVPDVVEWYYKNTKAVTE